MAISGMRFVFHQMTMKTMLSAIAAVAIGASMRRSRRLAAILASRWWRSRAMLSDVGGGDVRSKFSPNTFGAFECGSEMAFLALGNEAKW